jgi:PAS domain S-box-containing protein
VTQSPADINADNAAPAPADDGRQRRTALLAALIVSVLLFLAGVGVTHMIAGSERDDLRAQAVTRAEAVLSSREERASAWLDGRRQALSALVRGDALRIIATELADTRAADAQTDVATELIFLRLALERQSEAFGASGLSLRHVDGQPWLTVGAAGPDMALASASPIVDAARTRAPVTLPSPDSPDPAVDILVPVTAQQDENRVVSVIAGRFPLASLIQALERPDALAATDETVAVVQTDTATRREDSASAQSAVSTDAGVLAVDRPMDGLGLLLRYSRPLDTVLGEARGALWAGYIISGAVALAVAILLLAMSWRQGTQANRERAAQSERFAERMAAEQKLLETIIEGITEYLFVVDAQGRVRHANGAACDLIGEPLTSLTGRTLADILDDSDTATLLLARVPEGELSRPMDCTLLGVPHWVMVLRNPLGRNPDGDERWVLLVQDVTELVEERLRAESIQRAVVRTLGRTVSAVDPYLADQAARMGRVALLIADDMGLDDEERMLVELTAQVSQIGKLFVPRDLLTKTERLTPEEREVIQKHVRHACDLLEDLDPAIPISQTLTEITERMDGSGYPNGLTGPDISLPGRILAVADVFTARTAARAYRPGAAPEDILAILQDHTDRYDPDVVATLTRLFEEGRY